MITFLWMLYLAFSIFYSLFTIDLVITERNTYYKPINLLNFSIVGILWSVWYMYYLN